MRALVIGAGRMGTLHRRVLRDLGCDVTTVDPDPSVGADYLSLPVTPRIPEVVCIACPIEHLVRHAAEWAGYDGWLLIEKPAAPTLADATHLRDILHGQRVAVGYVERFNPRVRRLRELLADSPRPAMARFTRHNDRPSPDVDLDLRSHDIDLRRFLGLDVPGCAAQFDTRAEMPTRRREIQVYAAGAGNHFRADLMGHDTSPLHAMWHAFLANRPGYGYARLEDAVAVLAEIECKADVRAAA